MEKTIEIGFLLVSIAVVNEDMMMFEIHKYTKDGLHLGVVSGMGRNKGTWDAVAYSLRTAQRWLMQCRKDDPSNVYKIEQV